MSWLNTTRYESAQVGEFHSMYYCMLSCWQWFISTDLQCCMCQWSCILRSIVLSPVQLSVILLTYLLLWL